LDIGRSFSRTGVRNPGSCAKALKGSLTQSRKARKENHKQLINMEFRLALRSSADRAASQRTALASFALIALEPGIFNAEGRKECPIGALPQRSQSKPKTGDKTWISVFRGSLTQISQRRGKKQCTSAQVHWCTRDLFVLPYA